MQIINRKARFEYQILEKFEAGVALTGAEAKTVKAGRMDISTAFVKIKDGEAFLINADIPVSLNAPKGHDSKRTRKLLLKKAELLSLSTRLKQFRLTLLPLRVYIKGRLIKVEIALAKPKRKFEKRAAIKARDISREVERELKSE